MTSAAFTAWQEGGIMPLQDHTGAKLGARRMMAGGRIVGMPDPRGQGGDTGVMRFGLESGMGTLGDIHPWMLWQTRSRGIRDTGAWAQSFAAIMGEYVGMTEGPITGGGGYSGVSPLRSFLYQQDKRFAQLPLNWPVNFSTIPKGTLLIAMPAMEERRQDAVVMHADPRLIAPSASPPGSAGTLVCDLQPDNEVCMDNAQEPGKDGRHARLQSVFRVVAMPTGGSGLFATGGNGVALNFSHSAQDAIAGCGMVWTRLSSAQAGPTTGGGGGQQGPITPGGSVGPITPGGGTGQATLGADLDAIASGRTLPRRRALDAAPDNDGMTTIEDAAQIGKGPDEFGMFTRKRIDGHGIACLASDPMYGPMHGGHTADQHKLGEDRDGHAINSGHIWTNALFFRNQSEDGPLLFEKEYPDPPPQPLTAPVHLSWDGELRHPWMGGQARGMWRWWAEVPQCSPGPNPPWIPFDVPPTGQPTPYNQPGGPTGPGPSGPRPPRPGGGGGGGGDVPGPGGGGGSGGGGPPPPPPPPPTFGYPITPNSIGPGGVPRFPGYPVTGGGPSGPSAPAPTGPIHPRGPTTGGPSGPSAPNPTPPRTPPWRPRPGDIGDWEERYRRVLLDGLRQRPWGTVMRVGDIRGDERAMYSVFHPMQESFAAIGLRPQLTTAASPCFEHNPMMDRQTIHMDEARRPAVLLMHAWGAQAADGGWTYRDDPEDSRPRGGTARGGLLLHPPEFSLEDYFGISSQNTDHSSPVSHLCLAPGVAIALGTPTTTGDVAAGSVVIAQSTAETGDPVIVSQRNASNVATELFRAYTNSGEVFAEFAGSQAILIPNGTFAERPSSPKRGHLRVNTEGADASSANEVLEWFDNTGSYWMFVVAHKETPADGDTLYWSSGRWVILTNPGAGLFVLTHDGSAPSWTAFTP